VLVVGHVTDADAVAAAIVRAEAGNRCRCCRGRRGGVAQGNRRRSLHGGAVADHAARVEECDVIAATVEATTAATNKATASLRFSSAPSWSNTLLSCFATWRTPMPSPPRSSAPRGVKQLSPPL